MNSSMFQKQISFSSNSTSDHHLFDAGNGVWIIRPVSVFSLWLTWRHSNFSWISRTSLSSPFPLTWVYSCNWLFTWSLRHPVSSVAWQQYYFSGLPRIAAEHWTFWCTYKLHSLLWIYLVNYQQLANGLLYIGITSHSNFLLCGGLWAWSPILLQLLFVVSLVRK